MVRVRIICIGKLKERYWTDAVAEYSKRLKSYCTLEIVELKESRLKAGAKSNNDSREIAAEKHNNAKNHLQSRGSSKVHLTSEETEVILNEGREILNKVHEREYKIALAIEGKALDSIGFSRKIEDIAGSGVGTIDFIIGGSLGLSDEVLKASDMTLSFSCMTFPHQMMRVILLEQIYRAFKIARNEPYHK